MIKSLYKTFTMIIYEIDVMSNVCYISYMQNNKMYSQVLQVFKTGLVIRDF